MDQVTNNKSYADFLPAASADKVSEFIKNQEAFSGSVQFAFAKLQLEQSQLSKQAAEQYMQRIKDIQKEQQEVAKFIEDARELQNKAKAGNKTTEMPKEMVEFMEKRKLTIEKTGDDNWHFDHEWEVNLTSLTNYQETISNSTQTLMVYLQDYISQYNSYLQGAMSAINNASQVLTAVATGR